MKKGKRRDLTPLRGTPPWEWTEEDGERILETLRDRSADPSDRLLAARLAGESPVIHDELADTLLAIAGRKGEDEAVRKAAVCSLGPALELADLMEGGGGEDDLISPAMFQKVQKTLRRLYFDAAVPPSVRRKILESSSRAPREWHENAIRAAVKSGDIHWERTAVFSMRFVKGFDREILGALDSGDLLVRYHAVRAAGNWGLEDAWTRISAFAEGKGTDREIRLAAIDAITGIRPVESAEILRRLARFGDEDVAEAALEALAVAEGRDDGDVFDENEEEDDPFL